MSQLSSEQTAAGEQLWARIQILLNLGQVDEAVPLALEAYELTEWSKGVRAGGSFVWRSPLVPVGWVFFDPARYAVVINYDILQELGARMTVREFCQAPVVGPCFRWYDVENWRLLEAMDQAADDAIMNGD